MYNTKCFCQHVFFYCATLNLFSRHEPLFWVLQNFCCCRKIFFVTHIIVVRNIISMGKPEKWTQDPEVAPGNHGP